ncbi:MAG: ABC transporter ATP-binding protein [Ilumatobacteraceae bacterium]
MSDSYIATRPQPESVGNEPAKALLEVVGLHASYGPIEILHGIDFHVDQGEVVVILGANGAGKTTTLRAICQMISTKGEVRLDGTNISSHSTTDIARRGVAHVPQGRGTLAELSVEDNLLVGAYIRSDKQIGDDIERWYDVYPRLRERRRQMAGSLSGGEQQMLAVARALMARPRLLLLDEPSLGLAPLIVRGLFERFKEMNTVDGTTLLIVEQNANLALDIAQRAYVLEAGQIVLSGTADELRNDDAVRKAYLGY